MFTEEIGQEYKVDNLDFLTQKITSTDYYTYLGRHPYDNRHMFAMKPSGNCFCPDNGELIGKMQIVTPEHIRSE